jgi:hypothetical protein
MRRLSERWFRLIENVSIIILSFAFFWGAMYNLTNVDDKIDHYLNHLSNITGNDGYSTISTMVDIASFVGVYILFVMPFAVIGIMIRGDKIGDKKRFILRFPLQFILFWLKVISRA